MSAETSTRRLAAMQALDLVHSEGKSGDYAFKHALVRDALYQSLLTGPRAALHLKIAEEIERRSGNRLAEVVETLAHHYGQTDGRPQDERPEIDRVWHAASRVDCAGQRRLFGGASFRGDRHAECVHRLRPGSL